MEDPCQPPRRARRFGTREIAVPDVPEYGPAAVKALRERHAMSQAMLAMVLNTSLSTVKQWETGAKRPGGASSKLLDVLARKGLDGLC